MADEIQKQIEAIQLEVVATLKTKEIDKIAQFYTEDVVLIPAGGPIRGREAIIKYWKAELPKFGEIFFEKNLYFELMNDTTAFKTDLLSSKDENGKVTSFFRTAILWQNVDGKWLYSRIMYNSGPVDKAPKSDLHQKLEDKMNDVCTYCMARDYASFAAMFTEDGTLVPDGKEIAVGRDAIRATVKARLESISVSLEPEEISYIQRFNDTKVYTNSSVKFLNNDGKVTAVDRNAVIWKEIDGEWFIYRAIFNTTHLQ